MRRLQRALGYLGLAAAGAALLAYAFVPPAAEVDIVQVGRGRLEVTVNEDGKTRIKERYIVAAPLAGELLRIDLHPGDHVVAGETALAAIEPNAPSLLDERTEAEAVARVSASEARLQHTEVQLERAQATYTFARKEHARAETLLPSQAVSQGEYDAAVHRLRTATEDVRAGEFAIQIAHFELQQAQAILTRARDAGSSGQPRFDIASPITGDVLRVFQESEGAVAPGARLMEIGNARDLEVEIDVLSSDAVQIPLGAKVYLEHWGSPQPLLARVRLVEPQAFLKVSALGVEEQRVNVIADFVDPVETRARLGDAYRVEARIVVWEADDVLKASAGSLLRHNGGWAVYRMVAGQARLTPVEIGRSSGLETEIVRGLNEHDELIAYPSDQVFDGTRVVPRLDQRK